MRVLIGGLLALMLVSPAFAQAPPVVTIDVHDNNDGRPAHRIELAFERMPDGSSLPRAFRTIGDGTETVAARECPALRSVIDRFSELPSIQVLPPALQPLNPDQALPPSMKDGYLTTLTFVVETEDGSWSTVTVAGGNAYRAWANETIDRLEGCWATRAE